MPEIIGLLIVIAAAALLGWSSIRAWRVKNRFLRWGCASLSGLLAAVACFVCLLTIIGLFKLHARGSQIPDLKIAGTSEQIQRGQAIANSFCDACHSRTGVLTGGVDVGKDFPLPVGSFVSANLTPAGQLKPWSDGEIYRAIRNSIDAEGRWLIIMSCTNAGKLSDDVIKALIAYIRSRPAAGLETVNPPDHLNLLGLVMLGAGMLPGSKPVFTGVITAPPKGPTMQYGEYILSYQDCRACHGANLTGGVQGQLPPIGPDRNIVRGWTLKEFITTLRTGTDPGGHELGRQMPWRPIGRMLEG